MALCKGFFTEQVNIFIDAIIDECYQTVNK